MRSNWSPRYLVLGLALVGCNGGGSAASSGSGTPVEVKSSEQLKARLTQIAASGSGGSGLAGMKDLIQKTDSSLLPDYEALEKAQKPDQVKAAANKLLAKLK